VDYPEDANHLVHGVVDVKRENAIFAFVQLAPHVHSHPPNIRFRGLIIQRMYNVQVVNAVSEPKMMQAEPPEWIQRQSIQVLGSWLEQYGLPAPILCPAEALLLELTMIQ
jgi:hypothetical protein